MGWLCLNFTWGTTKHFQVRLSRSPVDTAPDSNPTALSITGTMALDLGTIITVVEIVEKVIDVYLRIEGLPQQMKNLGRRMERLNIFLGQLEGFVKRKPKTAFATLYSGQLEDLGKLLAGIQENAERVYDIFDRYKKGILSRSKNLEFRAKWVSNIWFSLVDKTPEKIQAIMDDIDWERSVLSDYLALMAVERAQQPSGPVRRLTGREPERAASGTRHPTPSPSPSPAAPRRNYKILFVDPYNIGRGVVAEALVKLFGQLTVKTGGDWRIGEVQSVGFFVKKGSDCTDVIDTLNYSYKSFKKPWKDGGQIPQKVALEALFDNKWCDHPFKKTIAQEMDTRQSRGLRKNMFTRFDYIVVFTRREHDNMIKLKDAIQKSSEAVGTKSRSRARILQLGAFISQEGGLLREILSPVPNEDGSQNRQRWNRAVADMKVALRGFLKQEMEWKQPREKEKATGGQKRLEVGKA